MTPNTIPSDDKQLQDEPKEAAEGNEPATERSEPATERSEPMAAAKEPAADGQPDSPPTPTFHLGDAIGAMRGEYKKVYDRLLRTAADFDNFKKRAKRDVRDSGIRAEDRVIKAFLPMLDNLERAIGHAEGLIESQGSAGDKPAVDRGLVDGVKMVVKQFLAAFERFGVKPFETVGEVFDPEFQEAIQQIESDAPRNVVVQEFQRGYRREDRLVRPAMVIVSQGPPAEASATSAAGGESATKDSATMSAVAGEIEVADPADDGEPVASAESGGSAAETQSPASDVEGTASDEAKGSDPEQEEQRGEDCAEARSGGGSEDAAVSDVDAGDVDAGDADAGDADAGDVDAGDADAGDVDAGDADAGDADAGDADAGDVDAGDADAGDASDESKR